MTEVDEFATAHQRLIDSAVQALGLIAQRVAAAGVMGGDGPSMLEEQVCGLLLPLTMETEPVEQLPPGAVKPAQAAYWVTEGAAFALLMLCGGGPAAAAAAGGNSVTPTMPAHHSDPRYAYGMCILALRRAEAGGGGVVLAAIRAAGAVERWHELYEEASMDVPDPHLQDGKLGGGIEWL